MGKDNAPRCRFTDLTNTIYDAAIAKGLSHKEAQAQVHAEIGKATRDEVRLVHRRDAHHSDLHKMS